jgi:uncharacterized protein (TIGR02444 family)
MSEAIDADDAWRYAERVFADAGRAGELVAAQDTQGLDIVLHLFLRYLQEEHGVELPGAQRAQAEEAVRAWRATAVMPLRAVRRALKESPAPGPDGRAGTEALRALVQQAELRAERLELEALCAWAVQALPGFTAGRAGP